MSSVAAQLETAVRLHQSGRSAEAAAYYKRILESDSTNPDALHLLGLVELESHQAESAIARMQKALESRPKASVIWSNLGNAYRACKKFKEAEAAYRKALDLNPKEVSALISLGGLLRELSEYDQALSFLEKALELQPQSPEAHLNLGAVFTDQGKDEEAYRAYQQAIAFKPQSLPALQNLASVCQRLGKFDEAISFLSKAEHLSPSKEEINYRRSLIYLTLENWDEGWRDYEARKTFFKDYPEIKRLSRADSLKDQSLLIVCEQGFGDSIQFIRLTKELRKRGAKKIFFQCQKRLHALLKTYADLDGLLSLDEQPTEFVSSYCRLLSLPYLLNLRPEAFQMDQKYLSVSEERKLFWQKKLPQASRLRVALAWQGSTGYTEDRHRSFSLETLTPLFECKELFDIQFISLQKGFGSEQLKTFKHRDRVIDLSAQIDLDENAFVDSAAILELSDLLITSDTSLVHLGGALGVPVWMLTSKIPDWRWGLSGESSLWYPSLRLFRQAQRGNWHGVIEKIRDALLHSLADSKNQLK
jgi:Flp pilus assembly protein TadD/aryl carrier-like protein